MPAEQTEQKYINVLLDLAMLSEIDDFRFRNRFPSRTEAIRWLIRFALKSKPKIER